MARIHATLVKWNEARGFGFLLPAQGSAEVFVHVSAFPRTGPPPRVGEVVSFEIEPGPDGRQRAVRLWRAGVTPVPIAPRVDGPVAPRMLPGGRRPTASRVLSRIAFATGVGALALLAANLLRAELVGNIVTYRHSARVESAGRTGSRDRRRFNIRLRWSHALWSDAFLRGGNLFPQALSERADGWGP